MDRPFGRVGGGGGYSEPAKGKSAADVLLGLGGAPAQKHVAFTADTKPSQAAAVLLGGAPAPAPAPAAAAKPAATPVSALLGGAGVGLGGGPGLVKSGDKSAGQIGLAKSGSTAADFLLGTGGAAAAPPTAPPATPTKPAGGLVKSGSTAADFLLGSNATGDAVVASPHPAQRAAAYFGAGAAAPGDAKGDGGFLDFKAAPALFADSYYEGEEKKYIKTRDPLYLARELEPKALFNAAAAGDGGAVNKLLLLGAAPSWRNVAGRTALHAAVWNHDKPLVAAALLDAGAPVDERTLGGFQWLLQEQEARDVGEGGATPLMLAAARGHVRTLAMLLERGASTAAVDAGGRTAADVARSHDQKDALELLLAAASDAEIRPRGALQRRRRRRRADGAQAARQGRERELASGDGGDRAPRRLVEPRPPDGGDDAARRGRAHRRADVRAALHPQEGRRRARHLAERRHGVRLRIGGGRRRAPPSSLARRSRRWRAAAA